MSFDISMTMSKKKKKKQKTQGIIKINDLDFDIYGNKMIKFKQRE